MFFSSIVEKNQEFTAIDLVVESEILSKNGQKQKMAFQKTKNQRRQWWANLSPAEQSAYIEKCQEKKGKTTMSREYKYKAWDVENKKMLSWGEIKMMPAQFIFERPEQFMPIQYIGPVDDESGKDIYEGDIIKSYNPIQLERGQEADYTGIVSWSEATLAWVIVDNAGKFIEMLCRTEQPEVIGNIHENPELLESVKWPCHDGAIRG